MAVSPASPFPGDETGPRGICHKDIAGLKVVSIRTLKSHIKKTKCVLAGKLKVPLKTFTKPHKHDYTHDM